MKRILVTGGTGFIGAHAVAALRAAGHDVRLLVRSPERIEAALGRLGVDDVPYTVGDVTDASSVRRAVAGCDAVVHAASVYSLDVRAAGEARRVNAPGTEIVLDEAVRADLDPIVHVSSIVALLPGDGAPMGPDTPVGDPATVYAQSKAASERIARRHQEDGRPVSTIYPGPVFGPGDPYLGEQSLLVRNLLKRRMPVAPRGRLHAVDVRDVGATIAAAIDLGGAGRWFVPGNLVTVPGIVGELQRLTGRRVALGSVPARAMLPAARAADLVQHVLPVRLPVYAAPLYYLACGLEVDDALARRELGIVPRPFRDTLADTVRSLLEQGHIRPREAGALAGPPAASEPVVEAAAR